MWKSGRRGIGAARVFEGVKMEIVAAGTIGKLLPKYQREGDFSLRSLDGEKSPPGSGSARMGSAPFSLGFLQFVEAV